MLAYWNGFVQLFFPPLCCCCDAPLMHQEVVLCSSCLYHLPFSGATDLGAPAIEAKMRGRLVIRSAYSCLHFTQSSLTQQLIHHLKYRNQPDIGLYMGRWLGKCMLANQPCLAYDFIVPIPLHASKLRKRGYNQSLFFAQGLSQILQVPINTKDFIRQKATVSQTTLGKLDRYANVEDVFFCKRKALFADKHLLLVDDVLTTGSTLIAAGNVLLKEAKCQLSVAVIAHV